MANKVISIAQIKKSSDEEIGNAIERLTDQRNEAVKRVAQLNDTLTDLKAERAQRALKKISIAMARTVD